MTGAPGSAEMRAPAPYDLVILDFDGTLADTFPWFCGVLNGVAARYGFRGVAPHEVEGLRGLDARAIMHRLEVPRWKLPLIVRHLRALAVRDSATLVPFPGIAAMLRRLDEAGLVLAVVSSNRRDTVRRVLGPESAKRIAHYACGAGLFGKAAKFRAVLRATRIPPGRTLCLGDEIRDHAAAAEAGLAFGAVGWGYTRPDALAATVPAYLFDSPDAVTAALLPTW